MADVKLVVIYPRPKDVEAFEVKISAGGAPIFLVAEEETFTFTQTANA